MNFFANALDPGVVAVQEKGYIGPQGEVYPNQPSMGQLQSMYGK